MQQRANPLRLGLVGGGRDALIGAVHREAARTSGDYLLIAGALSSTPEKALASARDLGVERGYRSWSEMLEREIALPEGMRIEVVSIVTPNHLHYPIARAFVDAGFHVICDKPLVHTSEQAQDLLRIVRERGVAFGMTYNYTGYPMIREARRLVRKGAIGGIRKVIVEYQLDWPFDRPGFDDMLGRVGWRVDPERSGPGGAIADLGSHAENLVSYVTGLEVEAVCADFKTYVVGGGLDDDANVLMRFGGGVTGVLMASRASVGATNDLRLRVHGESGSLAWRFNVADRLLHVSSDGEAKELTQGRGRLRSPAHVVEPMRVDLFDGFVEAFTRLYVDIAAGIRGRPGVEFPTVRDGARGVAFIEACIKSAKRDGVWTSVQRLESV